MSKTSRRPNRAARHQVPPVKSKQPGRNRRYLYGGLAVLAAAALLGASLLVGGSSKNTSTAAKVGAEAPSFAGYDVVSGRQLSSRELAGKDVLYFFNEGVMCQACLVQIQSLEKHLAHLSQRHLTLVSITNDDPSTLRQAAADYRITTPLIADSSRELTKRFGALGGGMHADTADHTFILVDRTGRVRFHRDYPRMWIDPNTLLEELPRI